MNNTIQRQPRPMGLTFLALKYQKDNSEDNRHQVLKHLINQYTLSGFRLNNVPVPIPQFAILIGVPEQEVMEYISQVSESIGAFNSPAQIQQTLTTIASLSTNWAIQDRGLISQQIELLARAQGGSYKPFISSELNKALKIGLDANKNFMEIYKTFFTQQQTNILNIYRNVEDKKYLTPEEAFEIVNDGRVKEQIALPGSLSDDEQHRKETSTGIVSDTKLDELFEEYNLGDSPECLENRTGTEALRAGQPDSQSVTKPVSLKAQRRIENKSNHSEYDTRRGFEYVDVDEVD